MEKVDEAIEQVSEPLDGDVIRVSRGLNDWLIRWAAGPVCQVAPATFEKHNRAFLNAQADLNANGVGVSNSVTLGLEARWPSAGLVRHVTGPTAKPPARQPSARRSISRTATSR